VGCFHIAQSIIPHGGHPYVDKEPFLNIFWHFIQKNLEPKSFVVLRGTMMQIETRDMLSLVLHMANSTSCTIYVIVQDGIDLIAHLEKMQHLH
jgi:hypothetical protein